MLVRGNGRETGFQGKVMPELQRCILGMLRLKAWHRIAGRIALHGLMWVCEERRISGSR